jgi:tyrosine-specific transport protein
MKTVNGILFVAGTCVGSGMIALPMTLAKVGLVPSILLMIGIWAIVYITALMSVELNLQAGKGLPLVGLCKLFSGRKAEMIGALSLSILSYSLLAAYIAGGSSIISNLLKTEAFDMKLWYTLAICVILAFPPNSVKTINNILFIGLLCIIGIMVCFLAFTINWSNIPLFGDGWMSFYSWQGILPVLFTFFGFQVIFHTLTEYCKKDSKILNRVFLFGSLIPVFVYSIWTASVLGAIYENAPDFYSKMSSTNVSVGELVMQLSTIAKVEFIQLMIWWISILAIVTSILGVGLGVVSTVSSQIERFVQNPQLNKILSISGTLLPPYLIVVAIPDAFISVLGLAGMILSVIAIILPIYLLNIIKERRFFYQILKNKLLVGISLGVGILIIFCELLNILK